MGERLLGVSAEQVSAASASFARATARGPDGHHPRTYTDYPIEAAQELTSLLQQAEATLVWPQQVLCAAFVFATQAWRTRWRQTDMCAQRMVPHLE